MSPNISKINIKSSLDSVLSNSRIIVAKSIFEITDFYKDIARQHVLFWEDNVPYLYKCVLRSGFCNLNQVDNVTLSSKLSYSTIVYIAGPQIYQRIFNVDISSDEVPDWIIKNRHRIWPVGIDDDILDFTYRLYEKSSSKYLYFCFVQKSIISAIEEYCNSRGLIASNILPRASLLLRIDNDSANIDPDCIGLNRGLLSDRIDRANGYLRIYSQLNNEDISDKPEAILQEPSSETDQSDYRRSEIDLSDLFLSSTRMQLLDKLDFSVNRSLKINTSFLHKLFKSLLYGILSILLLFVIANIYLSIKESHYSEALAELELLQKNEKQIDVKIGSLENELTDYSNLLSKHSTYGLLIVDLSKVIPDSLWFRYLDITDNISGNTTVVLKGYTVDRTKAAQLANRIESIDRVVSVEINSLNHIDDRVPEDIPSRFSNSLYRFTLTLEVEK